MITKIIHYCWFGKKPLSKDAKKCIESWKKFFPDYKIIEWNEENFDFSTCKYACEAYQAKKWAFVSDYARFKILYEHGGIYFDTDVEVIRPFDDIIARGPFFGCESQNQCNPGLGMGAAPGMKIYRDIIDMYEQMRFFNPDGSYNIQTTVVGHVTDILQQHGFQGSGKVENVCNAYIYPVEFFCPMHYMTYELVITENTRSIHHYSATWLSPYSRFKIKIQKMIGHELTTRIQKLKRDLFYKK